MKRYHQFTQDMLARVLQYKEDHPISLAIARAHALFASLATFLAAYTTLSGAQAYGRGGYRAGASERRLMAEGIRRTLLDMAATARGLEPLHPGISEQFRLGRQASSHQRLLAIAQAFLKAIEPPEVKQLFTDRAFAPDFDAQLAAKTAALAEAVGRKASGLQEQKRGTEGMAALSREVNATMRELRALMEVYLRDSNPALFEVWKAAARIYRGSERVSTPRAPGREMETAAPDPALPHPWDGFPIEGQSAFLESTAIHPQVLPLCRQPCG